MLNVIDEFTHECLAIRIDRKLKAVDVIDLLSDLFMLRGVPEHIRSDNGPEFMAKAVQDWITAVGATTAYIAPGQSVGERLHRELQCPSARRTAQWRNLLHPEGSPDRHRELAPPLQRRPPSCLARLQTAGARTVHARPRRVAVCATPTRSDGHAPAGAETAAKLTLQVDHSMGAGQSSTSGQYPNVSPYA